MDDSVDVLIEGKPVRVPVRAFVAALEAQGVAARSYQAADGGIVTLTITRTAPPPSNVGTYWPPPDAPDAQK